MLVQQHFFFLESCEELHLFRFDSTVFAIAHQMVEVQVIGKVKVSPGLRGPGALRPLDHVNCIAHRNTSRYVSLILQVRSSIK